MKILTKRQKQIEAHRALKKIITTSYTDKVIESLKSALNEPTRPVSDFELGDESIVNEIVTKFKLK